jgi:hypothetical protein
MDVTISSYVTISSDADAANLQHDLDAEWESKWLMKFHPEKCVGSSLVPFLERMTFSWCQYGRMVSGMTCCVIFWFFSLLELACFPC